MKRCSRCEIRLVCGIAGQFRAGDKGEMEGEFGRYSETLGEFGGRDVIALELGPGHPAQIQFAACEVECAGTRLYESGMESQGDERSW